MVHAENKSEHKPPPIDNTSPIPLKKLLTNFHPYSTIALFATLHNYETHKNETHLSLLQPLS